MDATNLAELDDLAPLDWSPLVAALDGGVIREATALQTVEPGGATRWTSS